MNVLRKGVLLVVYYFHILISRLLDSETLSNMSKVETISTH